MMTRSQRNGRGCCCGGEGGGVIVSPVPPPAMMQPRCGGQPPNNCLIADWQATYTVRVRSLQFHETAGPSGSFQSFHVWTWSLLPIDVEINTGVIDRGYLWTGDTAEDEMVLRADRWFQGAIQETRFVTETGQFESWLVCPGETSDDGYLGRGSAFRWSLGEVAPGAPPQGRSRHKFSVTGPSFVPGFGQCTLSGGHLFLNTFANNWIDAESHGSAADVPPLRRYPFGPSFGGSGGEPVGHFAPLDRQNFGSFGLQQFFIEIV